MLETKNFLFQKVFFILLYKGLGWFYVTSVWIRQPRAAEINLLVKLLNMVSEKEKIGIRRFVKGQLRDELDLRYV